MHKTRAKNSLTALLTFIFAIVFGVSTFCGYAFAASESIEGVNDDKSVHYISVYDEDKKINIRSDATTVREVLLRAEIVLNSGDKVEPSLDEKIASEDFNINIYRARDVIVLDGYHKKHVRTASTTPEEIATDAGVELLDADVVELVPYNSLLESGKTTAYSVKRAKTVNINFYGKNVTVRTQKNTINELLKEQEIDTNTEKNWVSMPLKTKISDGMHFIIQPQGVQTITAEENISYSEKTIQDYDMEYGKRSIVKYGELGKKTVTYEVNMKDGKELSRKVLSVIVTKEPVTQEVKVGMKLNLPSGSHEDWMAAAGISASDYGYVNYIISHESSWRPNASNGRYFGLYQTSQSRLINDCGGNWVNDPVCQLRSATGYATSRYGSWANAYSRWRAQGWW